MYRRYIVIGIVFLLLIGAYFVFFDKDKSDKEYEKYYNKLVDRDNYSDSLNGISLSIDEISEDNKYSYIVTFDNVSEREDNVKILVVNGNAKKDNVEYYPSFGIVDNEGYSLILSSEDRGEKEIKGVNLTILESDKIEYLLIYFSSDDSEQFVRVSVGNYLN